MARATQYTHETGRCPTCGCTVKLRKSGNPFFHRTPTFPTGCPASRYGGK